MSQEGIGGVSQEAQDMQTQFWHKQLSEISGLAGGDFKQHELPLARIKKIMKLDEEVKMISAEAPVLFSKAAEIFISELSLRAWIHTEENKRRTLQRNDIAMAITKYDQFDFLIDIVPREEIKTTTKRADDPQRTPVMADQVQYYFQLAQQAAQNNSTGTTATSSSSSSSQVPVQQPVLQLGGTTIPAITIQPQTMGEISQPTAQLQPQQPQQQPQQQQQQQIIQVQVPQTQPQQQPQQVIQQSTQQQQQPQTQVFQQVLTSSGELQNVPIQLTPAQIQAITVQMQGKQPGQPILIQTQPQADEQAQSQAQGDQSDLSQPLFQVPLNIGGQQVFIQQAGDSLQDQVDVHEG